ncbi:MAG: hypothetical protein H6574_02510 [Lewinellaceae bacterium]|nr:hypothetical protein [Saprospiraceae bacterium]MCB9329931.1 hypothetical protein [Lewinellaceae bacterium]
MIRSLIKLGLLLLAGILVYNYFWGTTEEKAQSKEVFKKTGDALGAAWNLLKSEKEKFDAGKYDKVLDQLGNAYKAIRNQAKNVDEKVLKRLDELEQRKSSLEQELGAIESDEKASSTGNGDAAAKSADQQRRKESLQRQLDSLIRDTDALLKEAQQ